MEFETFTLAGFVFVVATLAAKALQRRRDVLYGPFIQSGLRKRMASVVAV
jgi:hypothetical protein